MSDLLLPTVGQPAPEFEATDGDGRSVRLADLRGRPVVLFFYPKDDTPGCTKEACAFRDAYADFRERGIEVLGISTDSESSHRKFADKYALPFRLVSDPDHRIADAYGVYGEKTFMGRTYQGVHRVTFLIGADGRIQHVWPKVSPEDHAREILSLSAAPSH